MKRDRPCRFGETPPGDTLPSKCKFYLSKTFKPLDKCPRCLLYKPADEPNGRKP